MNKLSINSLKQLLIFLEGELSKERAIERSEGENSINVELTPDEIDHICGLLFKEVNEIDSHVN